MFGPLTITRDGAAVELAASRKLRGLFAYLAMMEEPVSRSRLCELFWDVPNDPRSELRWCLSKLRRVVDEDGRQRVVTSGDMIGLDLGGWSVDAHDVARACDDGIDGLPLDRLRVLAGLVTGDFLEGLEIGRNPAFDHWLAAQRRRLQLGHRAILERLAAALPAGDDEALACLESWIAAAPFDPRPHVALLAALMQRGEIDAAERHFAGALRQFEAEGIDDAPLRAAWQDAKTRGGGALSRQAAAPGHLAVPGQAGARQGVSLQVEMPGGGQATARLAARAVTGAAADASAAIARGGIPVPDAPISRRAALAVMPFVEQASADASRGGLADGLTHDIITRLAKLRNLFIIARGSVFALAEEQIAPHEAGRRLKVDYVTSGTVRQRDGRVTVTIELIETHSARIVWAETFDAKLEGAFAVLDEMGNRIVASIANEIELVERNRAILLPPNSLDAWGAYHRGLWHMYRFTKTDNGMAQYFFQRSVRLDPTFARAHAGLSFTHWQNAFQRWADREQESVRAIEAANQSLLIDDHDPSAHWAMGRALWLRKRETESLAELERAVDLSPNFALGHYALSFVHSQSGDPSAAIRSADHSCQLSPFDPLLFAMLSSRAMAHARLGQFDEAAEWAVKAASRPNAHAIIVAIAAHCLAMAGRVEEGRAYAATLRKTLPHYRSETFLQTFQFTPDAVALFRQAARQLGLD
jgi:TolB-like protein/DNA-binding SARP family transcriptional activator